MAARLIVARHDAVIKLERTTNQPLAVHGAREMAREMAREIE
jgi:hypothetical protein